MNFFGSFFSCINTAGSLSRSTVQAISGGKTQVLIFEYNVTGLPLFYS